LIGAALSEVAESLTDLHPTIVVLNPNSEILAKRDAERHKTGYSKDFPPTVLADALAHETSRLGLWLDTSQMTPEEVVERILARDG
jgi:hypothetical protein